MIGSSGYSMELLDVPDDYDGDLLDYIVVKRPDGQKERFDKYGRLISVTKQLKHQADMLNKVSISLMLVTLVQMVIILQ